MMGDPTGDSIRSRITSRNVIPQEEDGKPFQISEWPFEDLTHFSQHNTSLHCKSFENVF